MVESDSKQARKLAKESGCRMGEGEMMNIRAQHPLAQQVAAYPTDCPPQPFIKNCDQQNSEEAV